MSWQLVGNAYEVRRSYLVWRRGERCGDSDNNTWSSLNQNAPRFAMSCQISNHLLFISNILVTERCVSNTNWGPATLNFAKLPQNQTLYHRTEHTMSRIYQQAYPMDSQTTTSASPFTIDASLTTPQQITSQPLQQLHRTSNTP